jgi:predicted metalloprotease with PDZ domain
MLDHRSGRTWRPLQDTAVSVQTLFTAPPQWANWRRSADYYPEGYLLWLEVDATMRRLSHGQKSLNDFARLFYGGQSGPPAVVPYKFEDVVATLNQVTPYDWARLLRDRLESKSARAPLAGIENGGWKLVYTAEKNTTMEAAEKTGDALDLSFSLGMIISKDGDVRDVIVDSPAYAAGLGPGMKIVAVNGRRWSKDQMLSALRASVRNPQALAFLAENGEYYNTYQVNYRGGERYPHLERDSSQADILGEIIKPQAPQ